MTNDPNTSRPESSASLRIAVGLVFTAALIRLIPHWPNFTPIGALALYGGWRFGAGKSIALPFIALFVSDVLMDLGVRAGIFAYGGFHLTMPAVYLAFALMILVGRLLRDRLSVGSLAAASLTASVVLFVVTNLGHWVAYYNVHDLPSLAECFTNAVPFFGYTVAGDAFYTSAAFGLTAYLEGWRLAPKKLVTAGRPELQPAGKRRW